MSTAWASAYERRLLVESLRYNLSHARRQRGLLQSEVASRAGIARNHYQLLEAGKAASGGLANPTLETLSRLSNALGTPVAGLLTTPTSGEVYSVFGYLPTHVRGVLDAQAEEAIFNVLMDQSVEFLGDDAAAWVARGDSSNCLVGLGIRAPTTGLAEAHGRALLLRTVAAEPTLLAAADLDTEACWVEPGLEGLVADSS